MDRILIVHTWGLGDMILLTPVLEVVHQHYPEIKFDFIISQKVSAAPIKHADYLGDIYYSTWKGMDFFRTLFKFFRKKYSAVVITSGVRAWKGAITWFFKGCRIRVGDYSGNPLPFYHKQIPFQPHLSRTEANYNLFSLILDLPAFEKVHQDPLFKPQFYFAPGDEEYAREYIESNFGSEHMIIAIHPGCNKKNKYRRWHQENFVVLIGKLRDQYPQWQFLIIAGPDEEEEGEYIASKTGCSYLRKTPIGKVAAVISQCQIMINTDSGIGHIASCFGLKIFTIFGPGDERQTAPFTDRSVVIRRAIECAPCVQKPARKCKAECLQSVTPDDVILKIKENI